MAAPAPKPPANPIRHHLHVARCLPPDPPPPPTSKPPSPNPLLSLLSAVPDWADAVQESRVRDRRPLYDHASWREHRSSRRHLRHLLTSLSSRVILSLAPPVSALTAFAAAIATYNTLLPAYALTASSLPYQLTAPALALLLVFRTEASYARFDEGRKAWMRVLACAADLAGMVMHRPPRQAEDEPLRRALLNYILAFPVALKCHIISDSDVKRDLQGLLAQDDLNVVLASKHRPRCIIEFISQSLQMLDLDEQKRSIMESKLSCFLEGIGVCEQLIGIPIPLSYTRLTSRFLVLWHLTLPVILWDECKWIVVPATFISAASLFCIEEVGVLIEEPFPMLALDALCKQLHDGIKDMMVVQNSVHTRLVAQNKSHGGRNRCAENGWPSSKREDAKID
ncbi:hypothetical protein PAHAL_9G640200 [Panicum hallii]|uniref:Uncharacterized protein n=1 Tax=Panicum hallii TaxID=206008 RepID=A0A2S3IV44_9POAL|nr:UPF0187 protein At3g61320, chloroplastic-like [Panicum hallii]PAN52068.1 hypothetical protein PAHAL_9G640200 [Panicum hallii]